jgi:hypothetical protein
MKKSSTIRTWLRAIAGTYSTAANVIVVDGDQKPTLVGERYHWETRGGRRIYHPSAYSKTGWSNMVYCHSTLAVNVGRDALKAVGICPAIIAF